MFIFTYNMFNWAERCKYKAKKWNEQIIRKKNVSSLQSTRFFTTFASDKEPLKQAGGSASGVLWYANHSRMWNWEQLPVRNPVFSQSPKLPLFKGWTFFHPKIRKNERQIKFIWAYRSLPACLSLKGHVLIAHQSSAYRSLVVWLSLVSCLEFKKR